MKRVCVIVATAVLLAGGAAFADARQHFLAGQDYYTQGRYEKAIAEFEEAYRLDPRPLLLYNLAQAWEKIGNLEKAVDYLKKYVEADPGNDDRATLVERISTLEERIAATGVTVTCNEVGAKVYVDDKEVGTTPITGNVKLSAGNHKIQVSKPGFDDFKMSLAVTVGQAIPVDVTLEAGQAGAAPAAVSAGSDQGAGQPTEGQAPDEGAKKIGALDVVPWVIAGVGAVGAGVGWGVLGSMAKNKQPADANADPGAQDDAHKLAIIADVVGAAGAAIAAAGVAWGVVRIIQKKKGESAEPTAGAQVSFAPFAGEGTGGAVAVVQF
jgi:tetratricopeptide (TPR) repeat protein